MQQDPLRPGDHDDDRQSDSLNDSAAEDSRRAVPERLSSCLAEFERVYRGQFGAVAAYFARRCEEPQLVAELVADTFVAAIHSFNERDARRTSDTAWAVGVARRVYARYRESDPRGGPPAGRGSARELLDRAETRELMYWIDVERSSRELMERLAPMSALDREAVELVDLCGFSPAEAARELGISTGALRVRLVRTHARLRREGGDRG
jgi:RNA polymerase sigma-70 factor (ECF subfamily)